MTLPIRLSTRSYSTLQNSSGLPHRAHEVADIITLYVHHMRQSVAVYLNIQRMVVKVIVDKIRTRILSCMQRRLMSSKIDQFAGKG